MRPGSAAQQLPLDQTASSPSFDFLFSCPTCCGCKNTSLTCDGVSGFAARPSLSAAKLAAQAPLRPVVVVRGSRCLQSTSGRQQRQKKQSFRFCDDRSVIKGGCASPPFLPNARNPRATPRHLRTSCTQTPPPPASSRLAYTTTDLTTQHWRCYAHKQPAPRAQEHIKHNSQSQP